MRRGEQAILTCAPEYAYGKAGSPPTIPPDATLKFDVCKYTIFYSISISRSNLSFIRLKLLTGKVKI